MIRIESTKEIVKVDHKDAEQAYSSFEDLFGIGEFVADVAKSKILNEQTILYQIQSEENKNNWTE